MRRIAAVFAAVPEEFFQIRPYSDEREWDPSKCGTRFGASAAKADGFDESGEPKRQSRLLLPASVKYDLGPIGFSAEVPNLDMVFRWRKDLSPTDSCHE